MAFSLHLRSRGIRQGDCVAIALPNSVEFIIAFFGAAHFGCLALLLDPALSPIELGRAIRQADARALATDHERASFLGDLGLPILDLAQTTRQVDENVPSAGYLDAPFVVQYSSGSIGLAKRVVRTQRNLIAEAENFTFAARVNNLDRIVCAVPLFHAHGLGNCLLSSVVSGATLVLADPREASSGALLGLLEREAITIFPGVPFIFSALAAAAPELHTDLSHLRLCISAGNFLPKETFDRFIARYGIPIRQLYGCTEVGSACLNLDPDPAATWNSVGRPLGTVEVRLVDGEIAVRTPAMTTGYTDLPTVNHHVFRDGWFFTDDLGEFDAEGRLYITGRKRLIVEVAGHKVDPREVEAVLLDHPEVEEVAVVGVGSESGSAVVKAVIVARGAHDKQSIAAYCRARLAPFKCPSVIEFAEKLPKTALGKVRRGALLAREQGRPVALSVADIERLLVEEVIRLVGQRDPAIELSVPLMEYGLTSTHWVELAVRIQARLGRVIRATFLWNYPTIGAMARQLARSDADDMAEIAECPTKASATS
jgi:long-chain acyl-CoA synthetase